MNETPNPAVEALVAALVDVGGMLSQIHAHMEDFRAAGFSAPDAPPVIDVMRTVIGDVLAPAFQHDDEDAIAQAAELVDRAAETIVNEIYCVPPQPPAPLRPLNRAQRRRRGTCA